MDTITPLGCFRDTFLGDTIIVLLVYSFLTTLLIIILIWILKNNFKKQGATNNGIKSV